MVHDGLVYIANPDNPSGSLLNLADLELFASEAYRKNPETVVLIDEAYMDVTDLIEVPDDAPMLAQRMKVDLRAELGAGITCSIGIAPNKMLAKLVSGFHKPDGIILELLAVAFSFHRVGLLLCTARVHFFEENSICGSQEPRIPPITGCHS